ncbi:DNA primase [Haloplanus rubicundus]|uniref:DNA primase large subunit PriL n=1 Tax=Haloplanus rubicundus TaxID=1547898 RepID=A0A345E8N7_9EURY|nr:DNA primase [Haloplanus rubicundus]AXG05233.1 DNA primase [Haloplanus rubicundus]AXG08559.1 DNA primase [Haloplanus rubicundus]
MRPDPLYARYPFFRAAREAVQRADISPPRLVTEGDPAVERARERVERALMSGTVESETPGRWSDRDELLSYPIARILVSLVDVRAAVEKYAEAEAETAFERLTADLEADDAALRSVSTPRADLGTVLDEFDLDGAVRRVDGDRGRAGYRIDVTAYLRLADPDWGDGWRLVNRDLADGTVPVDDAELTRLLREAVRRRVADGLPFEVRGSSGGDAIADALAEDVATLRDRLAERERLPDVDAVVPAQFPPCMQALLEDDEDPLDPHAAFAATAFLVSLGLDADAIAERWPVLDDGSLSYRATVLDDRGGSQYPAPSCATMQTFGDCVNPDERCETIDHPLRYYAAAVADADADANAD